MKKVRRGFTLVEVSLFLVITAAVFVSIAVGTQNSIFQQRYNDAVQNFAEFLRSVYSQVTNVQNDGNGRSGKAIYGKLVVFGDDGSGNNAITTYNVIGDAKGEWSIGGGVLGKLSGLGANVLNESGEKVGWVEDYKPRWASQIQTTKGWNDLPDEGQYDLFKGSLLVVRHPSSGVVYTFVSSTVIDVEGAISSGTNPFKIELSDDQNLLKNGTFSQQDVDFCVNPNGADRSSLRRDVRIVRGAKNSSGIEVVSESEDIVAGVNVGNRCKKD